MTQAVLKDETVLSLAEKTNNARAQEFACYAPLVFTHAAQGDQLAIGLIQQAAKFVNSVMRKLLQTGSPNIAFIGGIAPHIQAWLDPQYTPFIAKPIASPEQGAMYFARRAFASQTTPTGGHFEHQ